MILNKYQIKLWYGMLESIEAFRKGKLQYCDLVYTLERALDAGELKNEEIIKRWYDFWTPLEIWSAVKGNSVTLENVNHNLSDMESFLRKILLED